MSTGCRDCRADLDHCHGTIVHHAGGRLEGSAECTEADCPSPELLPHAFAADCDVLGCRCAGSVARAV
ncbi:hypothetical protein [Mycobacterium sp.]|uniref:hypothetical protein n=1 Tax=Mycobacterium sp. TaxID=1785 RepID=UPI003BAB171D